MSYSKDLVKNGEKWHIFSEFLNRKMYVFAAVAHNEIDIFYVISHNKMNLIVGDGCD